MLVYGIRLRVRYLLTVSVAITILVMTLALYNNDATPIQGDASTMDLADPGPLLLCSMDLDTSQECCQHFVDAEPCLVECRRSYLGPDEFKYTERFLVCAASCYEAYTVCVQRRDDQGPELAAGP